VRNLRPACGRRASLPSWRRRGGAAAPPPLPSSKLRRGCPREGGGWRRQRWRSRRPSGRLTKNRKRPHAIAPPPHGLAGVGEGGGSRSCHSRYYAQHAAVVGEAVRKANRQWRHGHTAYGRPHGHRRSRRRGGLIAAVAVHAPWSGRPPPRRKRRQAVAPQPSVLAVVVGGGGEPPVRFLGCPTRLFVVMGEAADDGAYRRRWRAVR